VSSVVAECGVLIVDSFEGEIGVSIYRLGLNTAINYFLSFFLLDYSPLFCRLVSYRWADQTAILQVLGF
jgi:hypothetical protein